MNERTAGIMNCKRCRSFIFTHYRGDVLVDLCVRCTPETEDFASCPGCGSIVPLDVDGSAPTCERCNKESVEELAHDIDCALGRK